MPRVLSNWLSAAMLAVVTPVTPARANTFSEGVLLVALLACAALLITSSAAALPAK